MNEECGPSVDATDPENVQVVYAVIETVRDEFASEKEREVLNHAHSIIEEYENNE